MFLQVSSSPMILGSYNRKYWKIVPIDSQHMLPLIHVTRILTYINQNLDPDPEKLYICLTWRMNRTVKFKRNVYTHLEINHVHNGLLDWNGEADLEAFL